MLRRDEPDGARSRGAPVKVSSGHGSQRVGPPRARLTHLALRVVDLEKSIEWYLAYTPFELLDRSSDDFGVGAWLADPRDADCPFVLVLSQFDPDKDPFGYAPATILGPFAHLGFELMSRAEVDAVAARAEAEGSLTMPPTQMPPPIGYICFVEDPDGNTVEFSADQGTYQAVRDTWGARR
jgi:catechol 2,3-dioxygenase-like lactoylglutathione lyase family enzyme